MLSIIIQEHNEGRDKVRGMLDQASLLNIPIELIYVTSSKYQDFINQYGPFNYNYPIRIVGNVQSCGAARTEGGKIAKGNDLLYMDSHVCFDQKAVNQLITTLNKHPDAIVAPAIKTTLQFPSCSTNNAIGYGVAFSFKNRPFEWIYVDPERKDKEFLVPFCCGCSFSIKKNTFNTLQRFGGFLGQHTGLSWEEEKCMRLWRLGHPTYSEPRSVFGHYFRKEFVDSHSNSDWYKSFVVGAYINVFNQEVWNKVEDISSKMWGDEWYRNLEYAKTNFTGLRNKLYPYRNRINEKYFLRFD